MSQSLYDGAAAEYKNMRTEDALAYSDCDTVFVGMYVEL
jgi:hypothetical protein